MEYLWKVTGLKTRDEGEFNQAVFQTYWTKTGTDENGKTGTFNGATPFKIEPGQSFVPFENLTEEIVLGWIKEVVVGDYEQHVNSQIQKQINAKLNPVSEPKLPWQET